MEEISLTKENLDFIITSLEYTRKNFMEYEKYPSYEYKMSRIEDVNNTLGKVRDLKNQLKEVKNEN